jgi:hypothetical protein
MAAQPIALCAVANEALVVQRKIPVFERRPQELADRCLQIRGGRLRGGRNRDQCQGRAPQPSGRKDDSTPALPGIPQWCGIIWRGAYAQPPSQ